MSSGEIRVVGSFQVTDGNKLMEAAKTVMDLTRKEKGCIQYELHQVRGSANKKKRLVSNYFLSILHQL